MAGNLFQAFLAAGRDKSSDRLVVPAGSILPLSDMLPLNRFSTAIVAEQPAAESPETVLATLPADNISVTHKVRPSALRDGLRSTGPTTTRGIAIHGVVYGGLRRRIRAAALAMDEATETIPAEPENPGTGP